jgi:hypothetical protein
MPNPPASHVSHDQAPDRVREAVILLHDYCARRDWAGWDPYDALNSRVFQALRPLHSRLPRLVLTQALKRLPINLRPLAGVPPRQNPKGIALFLASAVRLQSRGLAPREEAAQLAERLISLRSKHSPRACWGYHFAWQTRTYLVPEGHPNIVCTSFAGEALLDAYVATGDSRLLEVAIDAGRFLLTDLHRGGGGDELCLSYTPLKPSRVFNASLLGGALLARLDSAEPNPEFREAAAAIARYAIRRQSPDGSWIYGEDPNQGWIDSFHTGYNLLALQSIGERVSLPEALESARRGFEFYLRCFFTPEGVVKYFHNRAHPIDAHAIGHALLTLSALAPESLPTARKAADWAFRNMRHRDGWFYFQKWPWFTNRVCHMRWSQAWMLRGLVELLNATTPAPETAPSSPELESEPVQSVDNR